MASHVFFNHVNWRHINWSILNTKAQHTHELVLHLQNNKQTKESCCNPVKPVAVAFRYVALNDIRLHPLLLFHKCRRTIMVAQNVQHCYLMTEVWWWHFRLNGVQIKSLAWLVSYTVKWYWWESGRCGKYQISNIPKSTVQVSDVWFCTLQPHLNQVELHLSAESYFQRPFRWTVGVPHLGNTSNCFLILDLCSSEAKLVMSFKNKRRI